ncbi:hypothetical protein [Paenibacillus ginsengarvi]|uniref:Uncharacterized protein n=1 Tax=Paenibacillus ginsengarvi TaxID=400777 RepID=A0A3B0AJG3_9BACL|nr:hypothetical protein [Paenibacillus ginsengarvi]RKN60782.1 hypothetical protein D7M11_35735 [Paenibacillus ginsengarvi]
MRIRALRFLTASLASLWLCVNLATGAMAAGYELTATAKKSFDTMTAAAGAGMQTRLNKQYKEWLELQQHIRDREEGTSTLRRSNDEALKAVREKIKRIDEEKLAPLKQAVDGAKERYKPLLDSYTAVNKQIAAAKPLQSKELNTMLRLQADSLKFPVQLAKQDIKAKDAAYRTAKEKTAAKQKKVRETLEAIEALRDTSQAEKASASAVKKTIDADWKTFSSLLKQNDANASSERLAAMMTQLEQHARHKMNMYNAEKKIEAIIEKANGQLPA